MDHDNPNLNDANHDHREWWEGVKKEEAAKAEKMDAEERLKHNSLMDDFGAEVDAATDWVEADWDQFKGRVQQLTNKAEIEVDEAV